MPTALALQLEGQNRRCDFCTHGDTVNVPTKLVFSSVRENSSGMIVARTKQVMLLPDQHVFCQLLHARVRASGQCDRHETPTK